MPQELGSPTALGGGRVDVAVELELDEIDVLPWMFVEADRLDAGIVENCLISGVATERAMVSGEAPGSDPDTLIVGKSVRGSAATGSQP